MKTMILKNLYPSLDYRTQVRELVEIMKERLAENDETLRIDVSDTCFSRSAMDEFYKDVLRPEAELSVTVINADDDYEKKLHAVIRSQNVKKHLRHFSKDQVIVLRDAEQMKTLVNSL